MFRNEFVNGIFDKFLISLCEIFVYFCIEFSVGQLSKSFLFVKVGAPNDYGTAFVGWFDNDVVPILRFWLVVHSSFNRKI